MAIQSHTILACVATALLCLTVFADAQSARDGEKGGWKNRSLEGANTTNGERTGEREGKRESEYGGWETNHTDGQKRGDHEGKREGERGGWKYGSLEEVNNTNGQKEGDHRGKREGQKGAWRTNNTDEQTKADHEGAGEGKTTILIAAASASVVCALCMILVAVRLCRKTPTKEGTAQIQADGVTVVAGCPVAASKEASDGIAVAAKVVTGKPVQNDIESNMDFDKFDV